MPEAPAAGGHYVDYIALDEVAHAVRNPKEHAKGDIRASINRFGMAELPLVDERTGRLVAGHGRLEQLVTMAAAKQDPPSGVRVAEDGRWLMPVVRGWASRSDDEAEAYVITSNKLTEKGGWDERALLEVLEDLADVQLLDATGYEADELDALRSMIEEEAEAAAGNEEAPDKGEALKLAGVTVGEPEYEVNLGEVWQLGRHILVVADVHQGWSLWAPLLVPGDLLWPYPTLLAPFTDQAEESRVVMVQPNKYLAGWVLTKWHRIAQQPPVLLTEAALTAATEVAYAVVGGDE